MTLLDYCKIVAISFSLVFASASKQNSASNITSVNDVSDPDKPIEEEALVQIVESQITSVVSETQKPNSKLECPICYSDHGISENDDALTYSYIVRNSIFKCPMVKSSYYCYKFIDRMSREYNLEDPEVIVPCPCCRTDLKDTLSTYREDFIEQFIAKPDEALVETFGLILSDFDGSDVFEASYKDDIQVCENILSFIGKLPVKTSQKIKSILRNKIIELRLEKFSFEEFQSFCFELEDKPENVLLILQQSQEFLKMLTPNQMAELIKRIFNINYPEDAQLNDSKNFLIDFLKLNYDAKKLFRISVSFLNIRSTAGFEIFIWLSDNLPIKFSSYSIHP